MKRIVTIQDISCFGKCSLTEALPILSAMGLETAVIPTAVLSTHTGGFQNYTFRDLTDDIPDILAHWQSLQLQFDAIYTGYLGSVRQIQLMLDCIEKFREPETKVIIDPVMGDNGVKYAGFPNAFEDEMAKLCKQADIIVPNLTEAPMLLHRPYPKDYTETQIWETLKQLTETLGCPIAVLTGVQFDPAHHGAVAYDSRTGSKYSAFREHIDDPYVHGTGDIFASVLAGAVTKGASLQEALELAVNFTTDCIAATQPERKKYWYGVHFEQCLGELTSWHPSDQKGGVV